MKAICFRADSVLDTVVAIRERIAEGFRPTLAIMFASVSVGIPELQAALQYFDFEVAGCSSCGEILDCGEEEVVSSDSVVGFLLDIPRDSFAVGMFPAEERGSRDAGREAARWGRAKFARPGYMVLGGGLQMNGDELVAGILDVAGGDAPLFGGLAGDDSRFQSTVVFGRAALSSYGVLALVLDTDKVSMNGVAASGWVGVGAFMPVTRAHGNTVYAIGGLSALDLYMEYLDISEEDLPRLGLDYPLLVKQGESVVLRAVMGVNKADRSLVFAGTVAEGASVQFSICPGFEVLAATLDAVRHFRERSGDADALLLFSCMARHLALGPEVVNEIHSAREQWDAPLLGFFSYGEIGADGGGRCAFHNQTFSLLALSEKRT